MMLSSMRRECIRTYHPGTNETKARVVNGDRRAATDQLLAVFDTLIELFVTHGCRRFAFQIGLDHFVLHVKVREIL